MLTRRVFMAAVAAPLVPQAVATGERRLTALLADGNMLPLFVGAWSFRLGRRSGVRRYRWTYRPHTLAFRETYEDSNVDGRGYYQFDRVTGLYTTATFFSSGVSGVMAGRLDPGLSAIYFTPLAGEATISAELALHGDDSFSYRLLRSEEDGTRSEVWAAAFERR